jgi:hypothetical protein
MEFFSLHNNILRCGTYSIRKSLKKPPFRHILMNLTNEASCPIMFRLYVIVVGGTFLFGKFLKMFMEFYVG